MPLITDGDIREGFIRKRRILSAILPEREEREESIPKMAYSYAKKMSEVTGLPLEDVLKSKPIQTYINRLREEVRLR